jgi:hypothetical protein
MRRATTATLVLALASACSLTVKSQRVPEHPLASRPADFDAPADVVVMHYYGSGGWGIKWRGEYLLLAPYFSNHDMNTLLKEDDFTFDPQAIHEGVEGTPIDKTELILIGHGHVDHTGDVGGLLDTGAIGAGRAALIADLSTTNELGTYLPKFSCVRSLEIADHGKPVDKCVPSAFRVTPIHTAHAPHVKLFGIDFEVFGGRQKTLRTTPPNRGKQFHLGFPWAFVIDLLDEAGNTAFRIHYMDAAAEPPHGVLAGASM